MTIDNAGNTLITARKLNLTSTTQSFTDFVGSSDLNDFYSFRLNGRSSLNLTLNSFTANADVQIIQDKNLNLIFNVGTEVITASSLSGTNRDLISSNLEAGNYFIRVFPGTGANTYYNLSINAQPVNTAPNNLQFGLEKTAYNYTETLKTSNGRVYDANGATDINRVDFKIRRGDGTFIDTADIFSVTPANSDNRWGQFNYSLNLAGLNLASGNYSLWAVAYDKAGTISNVVEQQFSFTAKIAPNNLQFGLEKTAYNYTETLKTTNGRVYDANGATDINRVDFKIRRGDGTFIDTADIFSVTPANSDNRWGQFNYSLNLAGLNLASGNYSLWAVAYDKAGTVSNVVEQTFGVIAPATLVYNSTSGYGLINAAAAVARVVNQNTFADVTNLGGNDWGADLVKAPEVWAKGYTGKGVVVAVLDTGVDYNHVDLKGNIWTNSREIAGNGRDDDGNGFIDDVYGWNFANNNNSTLDIHGHGTHVAGTIAGVRNNFGVTGIAYDAKIMSVKVLGDDGSGSSGGIARGIRYAVNNGANVINMSLGGDSPMADILSALEYASSKGVIVVMASGNSGVALPGFPARYADKWGLAVGAVDKNNNMASFSNRAGSNPLAYITAPGAGVYSTITNNGYAFYSGTSMATPHVAGVVALMLSANPRLSHQQVREIVTQTAVSNKLTSTSFAGNKSLNTSTASARQSGVDGLNNAFSSIDTTRVLEFVKVEVNQETALNVSSIVTNNDSFEDIFTASKKHWLQFLDFSPVSYSDQITDVDSMIKKDKKILAQR